MRTYFYGMTNSGLYLYCQGTGLLIDGLYGRGPYQCFSHFPEQLHRQMVEGTGLFAHLDSLLFTHAHGDHCDPDQLYYLRITRPELPVYGYGMRGNTWEMLEGERGRPRLKTGPFTVKVLDTVHEQAGGNCDKALFGLPNCMLLLETGEERFLLTGDAVLGGKEAEAVEEFGTLDAVFSNPLQLATHRKCEFYRRVSMKRLLLTHLPAPADDWCGYWTLARQVRRDRVFGTVRPEIMEQMSWLDGAAPDWAK